MPAGPPRVTGTVGVGNLLVIVLIADAAQNAMAGAYASIADGLILVMTILFWSYTLDHLSYKWRLIERFVYPPPLPLVRNGRLLYRNMRKELITEHELMSLLREQGVDNLKKVRSAFMEGDGKLSVVITGGGVSVHPARKATL